LAQERAREMKVKAVFSYRNTRHDWVVPVLSALKDVPDSVFFDDAGKPLEKEVKQLDGQLCQGLLKRLGPGVEQDHMPMAQSNKFNCDIFIPTQPGTLIEVEKGKLPRLELDLLKIVSSILRSPGKYGYGCIIVPASYIRLNLAGRRTPYDYVTGHLIPMSSPVLDSKDMDGQFPIRDVVVVGYVDPRGE
jgi:hypothetical protein